MTIEEFKKKYGTEGVNAVIRDLASRLELSSYYAKEVESICADLKSMLEEKKGN